MKLNLFKKTEKGDKEKQRILELINRANELFETNPKFGIIHLDLANRLYNHYNNSRKRYETFPELTKTIIKYWDNL